MTNRTPLVEDQGVTRVFVIPGQSPEADPVKVNILSLTLSQGEVIVVDVGRRALEQAGIVVDSKQVIDSGFLARLYLPSGDAHRAILSDFAQRHEDDLQRRLEEV